MTERRSCFTCKYCKKIEAFQDGRSLGIASVECTKDGSWPFQWTNHKCSSHEPKEEMKEET